MEDLSTRQKDVLNIIYQRYVSRSIPPTYREIGDELGIRSTNGVSDHIKALKRKGYLQSHEQNNSAAGDSQPVKRKRGARTLILTEKSLTAFQLASALHDQNYQHHSAPSHFLHDAPQTFGALSGGYYGQTADSADSETESTSSNVLQYAEELINSTVDVPVLGAIAAGAPILAEEHCDQVLRIDKSMASPNSNARTFALRVRGESMINEGIMDGDIVIVQQQQTCRDGDIVVALIDGDATVKTFFRERTRIRLQPANDGMQPIYVDPNQQACIQGIVIGVYRSYLGHRF